MAPPACFECRPCSASASWADLEGVTVGGKPLLAVPRLPRCACALRLSQKGKPPPALANLLATCPSIPEGLRNDGPRAKRRRTTTGALGPDAELQPWGVGRPPPAARGAVRTTWDMAQLPASRELLVYDGEVTDEALLGSVIVGAETTITDVLKMLREQLEVDAAAVARGATGSKLKVPIHKRQLGKPARAFFPAAHHHLLVMALADEVSGSDDDA